MTVRTYSRRASVWRKRSDSTIDCREYLVSLLDTSTSAYRRLDIRGVHRIWVNRRQGDEK